MVTAGSLAAHTEPCSIRLQVVDATGAGVTAEVRVKPKDSSDTIHRGRTDRDGNLCVPKINPGTYTLVLFARGFQVRRVRDVMVNSGETLDLRSVRVDIGDCDAPGITCDSLEPERDIVAGGGLTLPRGCGLNLDKLDVICSTANSSRDVDLIFTGGGETLFLNPQNGARIRPDCQRSDSQTNLFALTAWVPETIFACERKRAKTRTFTSMPLMLIRVLKSLGSGSRLVSSRIQS